METDAAQNEQQSEPEPIEPTALLAELSRQHAERMLQMRLKFQQSLGIPARMIPKVDPPIVNPPDVQ